jgi:hypothetical protein
VYQWICDLDNGFTHFGLFIQAVHLAFMLAAQVIANHGVQQLASRPANQRARRTMQFGRGEGRIAATATGAGTTTKQEEEQETTTTEEGKSSR